MYPHDGDQQVTPTPSFPDVEQQTLAYWAEDDTFTKSIAQRDGAEEWVFYDGPPFANGLPHYGHLLTGYAKDLFPRFQTMRGKQVQRRFGWDTHGLPAELEVMKQLGITEKSEIESMGIDAFNERARKSVLEYTEEWRAYVTRQARWVDFDNDYKTLDITFMESVLWAFKQLYDKGLAYEGYRVLPYCWRDETPLSNHELRMDDDVYRMRQDHSVTVTFPLRGAKASELGLDGVRALAWTTTPWTLPTNFSLAVGPDIDYVVVPAGPDGAADGGVPGVARYLLARDVVGRYAKDLGYADAESAQAAADAGRPGSALEYVQYERLWDAYADTEVWGTEHAWIITVADYVTTEDGVGIVHQASAYGEVDQQVSAEYGIPVIQSIDDAGRFLPLFLGTPLDEVVGEQVFEANMPIVRILRDQHRLLRHASYEHSYPHCWRCKSPLIYKAVSSWFVRVTEIKDRLLELNEQIEWVPGNVKHGQFGKWLENARDWSVSRNRYWGSPIPVWKSDDPQYPRIDVYGSLDELERDFGVRPTDLHRPFIDELTRPNPDDPTGQSVMRRIPDVFDVWFDSGSMPFAQVHYPFENQEWFESHSPADFIVEYIGQTRGWFYLMHVLSGALFDRPAFTSCISHGIVLGSDGQKMSKSLRNYPDVNEVFDRDGSDAMRWFLMSSSVLRGGNLVVTEEGIREGVRQFLLPLWSTWYFFSLYANAATPDGYEATWRTDSEDPLDRYILSKTHTLVRDLEQHLEALDATSASLALRDFAEVLTNWYVRRSRDRFWAGDDTSAFDTLYTVLEVLTRAAAPLAPLVTEKVWRGLTGGESVHLTDWPDAALLPHDAELEARMDAAREIASAGQALRKQTGKRVRLPLPALTVVSPVALDGLEDVLADELNVKRVVLESLVEESLASYGIERRLSVNARAAGPRLGGQVQAVIKAAKAGDWQVEGDRVIAGGIPLEANEYELTLDVHDPEAAVAFLPGGGFVVLDTRTSQELEDEGLARDVIRAVQQRRREQGLDVSDRILLVVASDDDGVRAVRAFKDLVARETLATHVTVDALDGTGLLTVGAGSPLQIGLLRDEAAR